MRIFDLVIAAAVVALIGAALWVFVLGGLSGESQVLVSQPPASQAGLTPTSVAGNRLDCGAIRGTNYLSPEERTWFLDTCSGPSADQASPPPSPPTLSADQPTPAPQVVPSGDSTPPPSPDTPTLLPPPPEEPSALLPADEPPPPPIAPPAATPQPPPPPQPPSDDDLHFKFTDLGMTTRAYFYVSVSNRNPLWAVCDLMFYVEYAYERLDHRIIWTRTESTRTISYLASFEETDVHFPDGIGGYWTFSFVDYAIVADWSWC